MAPAASIWDQNHTTEPGSGNYWNRHLADADLSTTNSQPRLMDLGKELDTPDEWKERKDSQLVNLGSSRFCIARLFHSRTLNDFAAGGESIDQDFSVFTGVEEVPRVLDANGNANCSGNDDGEVEFRMTPHRSRYHTSSNGTSIGIAF